MVGIGDMQPLANMQWSPISTRPIAATITPRFRNVPSPIVIRRRRRRGDPDAGLQQRLAADPQPILAQCLEHIAVQRPAGEGPRRIISTWIRARFHGSELRSYQRHFWIHSCGSAGASPGLAARGLTRVPAVARRPACRPFCAGARRARLGLAGVRTSVRNRPV